MNMTKDWDIGWWLTQSAIYMVRIEKVLYILFCLNIWIYEMSVYAKRRVWYVSIECLAMFHSNNWKFCAVSEYGWNLYNIYGQKNN